MQIHQLPEQQTLSDSDMFAVDTGQTTRRTPFNALKAIISAYAHQLTNLTETTATSDSDVIPIDDGNGAKKITFGNLKNKITEGATPAFNSVDASSSTAWTSVSVLTSSEVMTSVLNKISAMFKNIRFLYYKIGSTNISGSGKSTITSAIGNTSIASIGDGTLTGAVDTVNKKIVYKSGTVTIPSGTGGQTTTRIDISDVLPSGFSAYSAIVLLNTYPLPYIASSGMAWVSVLDNTHLEIANTTSAWNGYNYYITLFCRKN